MDGNAPLRRSASFPPETIHEIQRAAAEGIYEIRGFGAKRRVPCFDDLLFLGASMSRYPLEGYREKCDTAVTLGTRFVIAERPGSSNAGRTPTLWNTSRVGLGAP